jgi:hypothetical protein
MVVERRMGGKGMRCLRGGILTGVGLFALADWVLPEKVFINIFFVSSYQIKSFTLGEFARDRPRAQAAIHEIIHHVLLVTKMKTKYISKKSMLEL